MTGRGCIIGQSGSGKSFLAGVIAEELCKANMPFCVIDTEGEYSSLKSMFNVIVVGGENKDVDFNIDYAKLFRASIANDVPVVVDVSDTTDAKDVVYKVLEALYGLENQIRKPYLVLVEEADKFAPQTMSKNANMIEEISVRGRKRGIGLLIATQRPANISKNVLSQCSYGFIGKLTIDNDLNAIKILFEDRDKLVGITKLRTGEFVSFGLEHDKKFQVKARSVEHMGMTPIVEGERPLNSKISSIIKDLKGAKVVTVQKKEAAGESLPIETVLVSFTMDQVKEYTAKVTKKQFVVFGNSTERVDSIHLQYLPLGLCNFRIPTPKKNEYLEYWAIVNDHGELVSLDKKVRFMTPDEYEKALKNKYKFYLKKDPVILEKVDADKKEIMKSDINQKKTRDYIAKLFPTAIVVDFKLMHLPVYRITLKRDNKVRVFTIDAIYGGELNIP